MQSVNGLRIRPLDDEAAMDLLRFDMSPLPAERDSILILFYRFFRDFCFAAYLEDEMVGALLAVPDAIQAGHVYLHYLVVSREKRGLGIGHSLMTEFMLAMKKRGVQKITLMTSNVDNIAFYAKHGFASTDAGYGQADQVFHYMKEVKRAVFLVAVI